MDSVGGADHRHGLRRNQDNASLAIERDDGVLAHQNFGRTDTDNVSVVEQKIKRAKRPYDPGMSDAGPPKLIALNHDDYHAKYVGRTTDGRQFFLTAPFVPASAGNAGREFLAMYLFDKSGVLLEARIEDLGTRDKLDKATTRATQEALIASLGQVTFGPIQMAPFRVERFGVAFGLIPRAPEESRADWQVTLEPGNSMAFWPPWTHGEYDT